MEIKNIKIDNKYLYLAGAFILGIGIGLYISFSSSDDEDSEALINSLKGKIELLEENNQDSYKELEKFKTLYDSIAQTVLESGYVIDSLKTEIELKNKEYDSKIDDVDSFKHSELEEFFTDRYNKD